MMIECVAHKMDELINHSNALTNCSQLHLTCRLFCMCKSAIVASIYAHCIHNKSSLIIITIRHHLYRIRDWPECQKTNNK